MDTTPTAVSSQPVLIVPSPTIVYAGFWKRVVASLLDGVILFIPSVILQAIFLSSIIVPLLALIHIRDMKIAGEIYNIISYIVFWPYYALMESSSKQGTLGKMIMRIAVTDESYKQISFKQASGRYFAKFLSGILLMSGFIMVAFTKKKQGLHDLLAGTYVIVKK